MQVIWLMKEDPNEGAILEVLSRYTDVVPRPVVTYESKMAAVNLWPTAAIERVREFLLELQAFHPTARVCTDADDDVEQARRRAANYGGDSLDSWYDLAAQQRESLTPFLSEVVSDLVNAPDPLIAYISPGTASATELAELMSALSMLHQMAGGSGLDFCHEDSKSFEVVEVPA